MSPPPGHQAAAAQRDIVEALQKIDPNYHEPAQLLFSAVPNLCYHTRLKPGTRALATRESAEYALACLDSGEAWRHRRARQIFQRLAALQDQDPSSLTYGIWPWFEEEPLAEMAPPDWNWADFIGVHLAQVLLRHREVIGDETREAVETMLRHAAKSVQFRNVALSYTNIAIMGTYVTRLAGVLLDDKEMTAYARDRLRRFHQFTLKWDNFPEFNSPSYTITALNELTRMLRDFPDAEDRVLLADLLEIAWREIATHWHAPSRQWAGPHSRSYSTRVSPAIASVIQRGLDSRAGVMAGRPLPALQEPLLPLHCPEKYVPRFQTLAAPRTIVHAIEDRSPSLSATTHLAPGFALGSVAAGSFWNQRRSLVGYFPRRGEAATFRAQFLHDGYDFNAAHLLANQREGRVLGAVVLAHDAGDTHPSFDRIAGKIFARDLRLRFEFAGLSDRLTALAWEQPVRIGCGNGLEVELRLIEGQWGESRPLLECETTGEFICLDVVFYQGPKIEIDLSALEVWCAFAVSVQPTGLKTSAPLLHRNDNASALKISWPAKEPFSLDFPRKVQAEADLLAFARERQD